MYLLPPATELRQGNVFTPVCQSFCSQGFPPVTHPLPPMTLRHAPTSATQAPLPHMPPLMHTPLPHTPPCYACPPPRMPLLCHAYPLLPCMSPYHACPPPCMPPLLRTPPTTLRHAVDERAVRILLECILVGNYV